MARAAAAALGGRILVAADWRACVAWRGGVVAIGGNDLVAVGWCWFLRLLIGLIQGGALHYLDGVRWCGEGVVVGAVGFLDDAELGGLGDEGSGAIVAVELLTAVVEGVEQLIGGDGLSRLDDVADDVAQGILLHVVAFGFGHGLDDLMGEVVVVDGEEEFGFGTGFYPVTPDNLDP